ncbi:hypothetical protein B0H13DRAFT_1910290 [Mycena leptocephala]|nr:hypothetical protein B0H13DRAFT_1910290 [Mycena leptocephala]
MWSKSSSAAEAPGHRLEGDAAEGRGDETAMTVQGYADTVGSVRPVNGREGARDLGPGLGGSERGMGREELNWRHSLLLVLDMRWRPSPDDDDFEQMNQSQRNDVMVHNAVAIASEPRAAAISLFPPSILEQLRNRLIGYRISNRYCSGSQVAAVFKREEEERKLELSDELQERRFGGSG